MENNVIIERLFGLVEKISERMNKLEQKEWKWANEDKLGNNMIIENDKTNKFRSWRIKLNKISWPCNPNFVIPFELYFIGMENINIE